MPRSSLVLNPDERRVKRKTSSINYRECSANHTLPGFIFSKLEGLKMFNVYQPLPLPRGTSRNTHTVPEPPSTGTPREQEPKTTAQQRDCHFSQFCRGLTWSLVKNLIPFFSHPADKWMFISKYAISWLFITHILSSPYHLHIWLTWP